MSRVVGIEKYDAIDMTSVESETTEMKLGKLADSVCVWQKENQTAGKHTTHVVELWGSGKLGNGNSYEFEKIPNATIGPQVKFICIDVSCYSYVKLKVKTVEQVGPSTCDYLFNAFTDK